MDTMELLDKAISLKDSVLSLKAVSDSFFREYVEGTEEANIIAVTASQETYTYLYKVLSDLVFEVREKAVELEEDLTQTQLSNMRKKLKEHFQIEKENREALERFKQNCG